MAQRLFVRTLAMVNAEPCKFGTQVVTGEEGAALHSKEIQAELAT